MEQWSIDQLVEKANELLPKDLHVGVRNVRHLCSKGVLRPPVRSGRNAYYGKEHLDELVQVRSLMRQGFNVSGLELLKKVSLGDSSLYQSSAAPQSPQAVSSVSLMDLVTTSSTYEQRVDGVGEEKSRALNFLDTLTGSNAAVFGKNGMPVGLTGNFLRAQSAPPVGAQRIGGGASSEILSVESSCSKTLKTPMGSVSLLQTAEQESAWRALGTQEQEQMMSQWVRTLLK